MSIKCNQILLNNIQIYTRKERLPSEKKYKEIFKCHSGVMGIEIFTFFCNVWIFKLLFARSCNMKIYFVSQNTYELITQIKERLQELKK